MAVARSASRSGRSPSPAAKALAGAARTPSHQGSRLPPHYAHRMPPYDSPPAKAASAPGRQGVYLPMFLTPPERAASAPGRNGAHLVSPDMRQPLLPSFVTTSPSATAKWSLSSTLVPPSITPIRTRPPKINSCTQQPSPHSSRSSSSHSTFHYWDSPNWVPPQFSPAPKAPKSPDFQQWDCPRPYSPFSVVPSGIHCIPPQAHCTLKVVSGLSPSGSYAHLCESESLSPKDYYSVAADAKTSGEFKTKSWRALKGYKSHSSKKHIVHKEFRVKRNFNKMMFEQGHYVGDSLFG